MSNVFALTQVHYRIYNDDGSESTSTPKAAEDTQTTISTQSPKFHLRIVLSETGAGSISGATTDDYQLQYQYDGGAFTNVTTTSSVVKGFDSSNLTDADVTTNRGTNGVTDGGGSFVAGEISEDGLIDDRQITANNFTEFLYALQVVPGSAADGKVVNFRVLLNGATTNMTYTVTPSIVVDHPSIAAGAGTLTLTGTAATPKHGWLVAGGAGTLTLTGSAAGLNKGKTLRAYTPGLLNLVGKSASPLFASPRYRNTYELREDGTFELREDGTFELRQEMALLGGDALPAILAAHATVLHRHRRRHARR